MTNGWVDIKNTDMMLIMGGNPAENHPCGFKWAIEAKRQRNAKMIVVDPRYTRTAAVSDLHLQIRAGADIAFLGGVLHYALENSRIAREYLINFTNARSSSRKASSCPTTVFTPASMKRQNPMTGRPGTMRKAENLPAARLGPPPRCRRT
jgi:formate dehydrogenase major subunit